MRKPPERDNSTALRDDFEWVRTTLFPRWHRGTDWSVKYGTRSEETAEDGYCDRDQMLIYIVPRYRESSAEERRWVLAHEVCHAVAGLGHGTKFCKRMSRAACDAATAGEQGLADRLADEVVKYENQIDLRAADIYGKVDDYVVDTQATVSYEGIVGGLSREFGMTRRELESKYKRLRRVYDQRVLFWRGAREQSCN